MKRHILTLILSLVTLCSYGQSGRLIYGCVYGERKMPLQGAKITTPHGELICTTDQNGQFNAQSSTYIKEIVVLHDDYQTKYVKVDGSYLIIKMRAATQTHTQTTDDIVDAEEEVQTTNLIAEHEARIANERRAAAEEAAKIRAEKIAKLEAELAAAKEKAIRSREEAIRSREEQIAKLEAERAAAKEKAIRSREEAIRSREEQIAKLEAERAATKEEAQKTKEERKAAKAKAEAKKKKKST